MRLQAPSIGIGLGLSLRGYGGGFTPLLTEYPATAAYSAYDLGNQRGSVTEAEGTVVNPTWRIERADGTKKAFTGAEITASSTARNWVFQDDADLVSFADAGLSGSPAADKRMYFDGVNDYVSVAGMTATVDYFGACTISADIYVEDPSATGAVWALGSGTYRLLNNSGTWIVNASTPTSVSVTSGFHSVSVTYNSSGNAVSFSLNGSVVWTGSAIGVGTGTSFYIGARDSAGAGLFFKGLIYNVSVSGSSVKNFTLNGYGNTDADWEDQVGSNDGTVNGSPALFTGQGFDATLVTAYDQSGNDYDATQTTAANQPLVFTGGDWTRDANGNIAALPDGVNDVLETTLVPPSTASIFAVSDAPSGNDEIVYGARDSTNERSYIGKGATGKVAAGVSSEFLEGTTAFTANNLLTLIYNGSTRTLHANGALEISGAQLQTVDNVTHGYSIFAFNNAGTNIAFSDAAAAVVIAYASDQSANRAAIEAKISKTITTALS